MAGGYQYEYAMSSEILRSLILRRLAGLELDFTGLGSRLDLARSGLIHYN